MSRLFLFCQLLSCSSWFSAQKWLGQWTASTSCDRTTCCCVQSAKVSLSAQNLVAEGPIAGQCDSATTIQLTAAVPSGMSWVALFGGTVFEVTISGDYSTMTVVNTVDRQCSGELYSGSGCNSSSTYILSMTCDFLVFFCFVLQDPRLDLIRLHHLVRRQPFHLYLLWLVVLVAFWSWVSSHGYAAGNCL